MLHILIRNGIVSFLDSWMDFPMAIVRSQQMYSGVNIILRLSELRS